MGRSMWVKTTKGMLFNMDWFISVVIMSLPPGFCVDAFSTNNENDRTLFRGNEKECEQAMQAIELGLRVGRDLVDLGDVILAEKLSSPTKPEATQ